MPATRRKAAAVMGSLAVLALAATACGDDDDAASGGDDVAAYCDFSATLDEGDSLPSDEQFETLMELAPSEISDQVTLVAQTLIDEGEAVFADESNTEFFAALEDIEAYEEDECGREDIDGHPDDEESEDTDGVTEEEPAE